jgi:hypothetical protein
MLPVKVLGGRTGAGVAGSIGLGTILLKIV